MGQSMNNLEKQRLFVKGQIAFHKERAEVFSKNNFRKNKHLETAKNFEELLQYLESTSKQALPKGQLVLSLTPDDLEGLPEELVAELSISSADKAEFVVLSVLEKNGGIMSLDQIMVNYYRETGDIPTRPAMTNRVYRLGQKNLVKSVPGKKGVYYLTSLISDKEIAELVGANFKENIETEQNARLA